MLYLSGVVQPERFGQPGLGFMLTPRMRNRHPVGQRWAADTGLWSARGARAFDLAAYLAWLTARRPHQAQCLFATAPDVVEDWAATWAWSAPVLPRLRALGYRAAVVAQDGLTETAALAWDAIDALFVGGSTAYKLAETTYVLVAEAQRQGKWTHMGRVNSGPRCLAAQAAHYDSVDGTILRFGPATNWPRVQRWLAHAREQPPLWAVPQRTTG